MKATDQSYCWRVGGCYFESGVHTWRVQVSFQDKNNDYPNKYYNNSKNNYTSAEVGIIEYDEVRAYVVGSQKKWVYKLNYRNRNSTIISLTLNMESRNLSIMGGFAINHDFNARRVSPFFACSSGDWLIRLMQSKSRYIKRVHSSKIQYFRMSHGFAMLTPFPRHFHAITRHQRQIKYSK